MDLNLTAPFRCIRRALPSMTARGFGRIVVVASVVAKRGEPMVSAYAASKHGVLGLVRSASREVAAQGVTVNAVCPGYVNTPMTDHSIEQISARTGKSLDESRELLAAGSRTTGWSTRAGRADGPAVRRERRDQTGRASTSTGERCSREPSPPGEPAVLAEPSGFSHAVVATGTTVHLAGQTALDATGTIVGDGVVEQFEQALSNLLAALSAAGGAATDLASLTVCHRGHGRLQGATPRDRPGLETARRHGLPGDGRESASPGSGTSRRSWRCRGPRSWPPAPASLTGTARRRSRHVRMLRAPRGARPRHPADLDRPKSHG